MKNLNAAFNEYVVLAGKRLSRDSIGLDTAPIQNRMARIRAVSEDCEASEEFKTLIAEAIRAFSGKFHKQVQLGHAWGWSDAVKVFFRRSGFYWKACQSADVDRGALFNSFKFEFGRTSSQVRLIAPIERVSLLLDVIECGTFTVRRFTESELRKILEIEANAPFVSNVQDIDAGILAQYWFIDTSVSRRVRPLGQMHLNWPGPIVPQFTPLPLAIERCVMQLALYDWKSDWLGDHADDLWLGPRIPFTIEIDDHLLRPIHLNIDTSNLEREIVVHTSGEEHEIPLLACNFDKSEAKLFRTLMARIGVQVAKIDGFEHVPFLNIACRYLAKGLFREGIDQLLAHITSIEASVGQSGAGVNRRLQQRLATILGVTPQQQRQIEEQFRALYKIRSDLVHGNAIDTKVLHIHLNQARAFARRAALWWLNCLNHLGKRVKTVDAHQLRADVLAIIDASVVASKRRSDLLVLLPKAFPSASEWGK